MAVIGAGAFGGWTALHLLRQGTKGILLDAWGPGNSRASSGGDTRLIRGAYGGDADYIEWVARSFVLWREAEARWRTKIYHRTGSLSGCTRVMIVMPAVRSSRSVNGVSKSNRGPLRSGEALSSVEF